MIFNMLGDATEQQINHIVDRIKECGFEAHLIRGKERTVIGVVGNSQRKREELLALSSAPGVEEIVRISHPFKLAARSCRPEGSLLDLGKGVTIGGSAVVVAAGPCAVESSDQILTSRPAWRNREPSSCAEARSSRARRPIASRDWARKA